MSLFETGHWRREVENIVERRRLEYAVQNTVGPIVNVHELTDDQLRSMLPKWSAEMPLLPPPENGNG